MFEMGYMANGHYCRLKILGEWISLTPPVFAEQFELIRVYVLWLKHVKWLYLIGQVFKLSSVLCLIIASFERYMITSHWTFSGFEERTRWLLLVLVLFVAVIIRFSTSVDVVILFNEKTTQPFRRYSVGQVSRQEWLPNFFNLLTVIIPFGTLVFFNGGIVLMLRHQNVQQLRSLITELTMGYDFMKVRRRNIRAATNTLLLIISIYLISNLLSLFLSISAFLNPGFLQRNFPAQYRISSDCASLLTVLGNALRFPAHFFSNAEVREQCRSLFRSREKVPVVGSSTPPLANSHRPHPNLMLRRHSERLDNPWFSALLTTRQQSPRCGNSVSTTDKSMRYNGNGRRRRQNCAAELEDYVRNGASRANAHGCCAVCNGPIEEECCSAGALGTERESMYAEFFAGDETAREEELLLVEEGRGKSNGVGSSTSSLSSCVPQQLPLDMDQLHFDPVEFATVTQNI